MPVGQRARVAMATVACPIGLVVGLGLVWALIRLANTIVLGKGLNCDGLGVKTQHPVADFAQMDS